MKNPATALLKVQNIESPFTELFSVLKLHRIFFTGTQPLNYSSPDLHILNQHISNAVEILLQGIQSLGYLLGSIKQPNTAGIGSLNNLGFFVSVTCNLIEALNTLQADTTYALSQQEGINF